MKQLGLNVHVFIALECMLKTSVDTDRSHICLGPIQSSLLLRMGSSFYRENQLDTLTSPT